MRHETRTLRRGWSYGGRFFSVQAPLTRHHSLSRIALGVGLGVAAATGYLAAAASSVGASPPVPLALYASPGGSGTACTQSSPCSLTNALSEVTPGERVLLTQAGSESDPTTYYIGNWDVDTAGTSQWSHVTIGPAPWVKDPILDGDGAGSGTCSTTACDGPVLSVGADVYATIEGITIQHGDNTTTAGGGGIENGNGASLTVIGSTFASDSAVFGGGIDNSDEDAGDSTGTVVASSDTFSDNWSVDNDGGAIDNGDNGGDGTLTIVGSNFTDNAAKGPDSAGGAIDNADFGTGDVTLAGDAFTANNAVNAGGAIASGIEGRGTLNINGCSFSQNTVTDAQSDGGAIDSGDGGTGSLSIFGSRFNGNTAVADGGAIDSGDYSGNGTLIVTDTNFSDNTTGFDGGAIDSGDDSGTGNLSVNSSVFTGNQSVVDGGAIDSANYGGTGHLTVDGSSFSDNASTGFAGGAIVNGIDPGSDGTGSLAYDTFDGNSSMIDGGAVDSGDYSGTGTLTVTDSSFTDDTSGTNGGAIMSGGSANTVLGSTVAGTGALTVTDSTFSNDSAANDGGAIDSGDFGGTGGLDVSDSTFATNSAVNDGGAIDEGDDAGLGLAGVVASTFAGNTVTASTGDGPTVDNGDHSGTSGLTVAADIFDGSCTQMGGSWTDDGFNVGSDTSCLAGASSDEVDSSVATQLGPLSKNGGPTQTVALLAGNAAIGIISNPTSVTVNGSPVQLCPTVDQRGYPSARGEACDAGAVQLTATTRPGFPVPPFYPPRPHVPVGPRPNPCPPALHGRRF